MDSPEASHKDHDLAKRRKIEGSDYYKGRERKEEWEETDRRHRSGKSRKSKAEKESSSAGKRAIRGEEAGDAIFENVDEDKGSGKRRGDRPDGSWEELEDNSRVSHKRRNGIEKRSKERRSSRFERVSKGESREGAIREDYPETKVEKVSRSSKEVRDEYERKGDKPLRVVQEEADEYVDKGSRLLEEPVILVDDYNKKTGRGAREHRYEDHRDRLRAGRERTDAGWDESDGGKAGRTKRVEEEKVDKHRAGRERLGAVHHDPEDGSRSTGRGSRGDEEKDRLRGRDAAETGWEESEDARYVGKGRTGNGSWDDLEGSGRSGRSKRIEEEKIDKHRAGRERGAPSHHDGDDGGRSSGRARGDEERDKLRGRDGVESGWEEFEDLRHAGKGRSGKIADDSWEDVDGAGRPGRSKRLEEGRSTGRGGQRDDDRDRLRGRDTIDTGWEDAEEARYQGRSRSGKGVDGGWEEMDGGARSGRSKRVEEEKVDKHRVSRGRLSVDYSEDGGRSSGRGQGDEERDKLRGREMMDSGWEESDDATYAGRSRSGKNVDVGWDDFEGSGRSGRSKRVEEEKMDKLRSGRDRVGIDHYDMEEGSRLVGKGRDDDLRDRLRGRDIVDPGWEESEDAKYAGRRSVKAANRYPDRRKDDDEKARRQEMMGHDARSQFMNNQGGGQLIRSMHQQGKGGRGGRMMGAQGGRVTGGRDQRALMSPIMGPGPGPALGPVPGHGPGMGHHFGHLVPPGMPGMGPGMPGPGPGMGPRGFPLPPFGGPMRWGGRGGDMGMMGGPPGPGPGGPGLRFAPGMGHGPGHNMFFNHSGPGRGSGIGAMPGVMFGGGGPYGGRGMPPERGLVGRGGGRSNPPAGRGPSRGEQNDYSQHFVDTGLRPQNFIRDVELADRFEEYPKLKELIARKDKLIADHASPPMYLQCDLRTTELRPEAFGTKFDVILVDPPWEEYVRRAPGIGDSMEWWSYEEIQNLRIEAIADTPAFIFLWVGDAEGLDQGRLCLKKWGFRRCEDICWVKTNRENPTPALRHDANTLFQHSKEHCLMGIKGTVRRSTDGHIIHANVDTDIIISEEPAYGSTAKPEELYHIIEHFAQGMRRIELFGEDHNIRAGWVTVGKSLSSSNFNRETYIKYYADLDGKVWQGGRGNPPVDAPHLVGTTAEIEALRPKSPPPRAAQQPSPATNSVSQPSGANSNSKKATQGGLQNGVLPGSLGPGAGHGTAAIPVINSGAPQLGQAPVIGRGGGHGQVPKPRQALPGGVPKPLGAGPGIINPDVLDDEPTSSRRGAQELSADDEAGAYSVEPSKGSNVETPPST